MEALNDMPKTILITGATDGIGLATAITLASAGHHVLLHGRNLKKLEDAKHVVANAAPNGPVRVFVADLSRLSEDRSCDQCFLGSPIAR